MLNEKLVNPFSFSVFYKGGSDGLKKAATNAGFEIVKAEPSEWNDETYGIIEVKTSRLSDALDRVESWFKSDKGVTAYNLIKDRGPCI